MQQRPAGSRTLSTHRGRAVLSTTRARRVAASAACLSALLAVNVAAAASRERVYINCYPTSSRVAFPAFQPREHPARCNIQGEPEDEAHLVTLTQAHWSQWGTPSAVTQAQALNNHPGMGGPPSFPVHMRLFRIRRGCHGRLYYTRAQITSSPGTGALRITSSCKAIPIPL
jgi:hypothetical protein